MMFKQILTYNLITRENLEKPYIDNDIEIIYPNGEKTFLRWFLYDQIKFFENFRTIDSAGTFFFKEFFTN